jgi:hypothetical protein
MSGYDNALTISYNFGSHDFGAGAGAHAIRPPKGKKRGNIRDIHLGPISEAFTQVTTPGYVRVGTTGDPDKYAELNCGAAAVTDGYNLSNTPAAKPSVIDMDVDSISQVEVVFVAPTGGTPAGIAFTTIVIDWF